MKFGVREITDVVFKTTTANQSLGSRTFTNQYDPVIFLDSAKTSTLESSVATVYAQGGRGNPRLLAWDGDKTVTFTFEEALISPQSFSVLSGADLNESSSIKLHLTEKTVTSNTGVVTISGLSGTMSTTAGGVLYKNGSNYDYLRVLTLDANGEITGTATISGTTAPTYANGTLTITLTGITSATPVLVDFYIEQTNGNTIEVTAEKFAGYYYIEANTLFRGVDGNDYPAQFTIPKAKVQSNFTFTMAPTGDPSTFTFTLDAFPGVVRGGNKKVLFALDVSGTPSSVI